MNKVRHYHGTNKKGLDAIIESGNIGITYPDGFSGFYVTTDVEQAKNHGQYVITIDDITEDELLIDENNGDTIFKGIMPLSRAFSITTNCNDLRTIQDIINNLIDDVCDCEDKGKQHLDIMQVQQVLLEHPERNCKPLWITIPVQLIVDNF